MFSSPFVERSPIGNQSWSLDASGQAHQAATLRPMMAVPPAARPATAVLAVGSGKGGVGKSVLSVLLAGRVAIDGRRVLLVDGNQNMGNLHVLLGVPRPARLEHLLTGGTSVGDLLVPVQEFLWLLPADSGAESLYALGAVDRARLHHQLSAVYDDFDVVVVDAGPGLESMVRIATMRGTRCVILTVPEPAALTDAYATIKILNAQVGNLPVDILVNRVTSEREGPETFDRLATATMRFLHREVGYLGALWEDQAIRHAVRMPGELARGLRPGPNADALSAMLERLAVLAPARAGG